jgi:hypothetical protein
MDCNDIISSNKIIYKCLKYDSIKKRDFTMLFNNIELTNNYSIFFEKDIKKYYYEEYYLFNHNIYYDKIVLSKRVSSNNDSNNDKINNFYLNYVKLISYI